VSKLLGVIKAIIGQVYVVDVNGAQRLVHEGDRVYSALGLLIVCSLSSESSQGMVLCCDTLAVSDS